jgi:hypothetical protein
MPPINFRPLQKKHLTPEGYAEFADMWREAIQAINSQMGANGPAAMYNDLNMNGHNVIGLGTPAAGVTNAALSQAVADPKYSTSVQQTAMEAVGTKMLQTTRRLNDGTQQHTVSTDLNTQGSVPPSNITGTLSYTTVSGASITWTWTSVIVQRADLSYVGIPNGTLAVTGLANSQYDFFPYYDTRLGILSFVADSTNGTGAPPIAILSSSSSTIISTELQRQNGDGRIALTASASGAQVTINGGSGSATLRSRS